MSVGARPGAELEVVSGAVIAYRMFDVAYSIDLATAEAVWARHARAASTRGRLNATPPKAVAYGVPPVALSLEPVRVVLEGGPVDAVATARLYDFGVISLSLRIPAARLPWSGFSRLMNAVDRGVGPGAPVDVWAPLLDRLRGILGEALVRPEASSLDEDYLMGVVHGLDAELTAAEVLERADLEALLSGEQRALSEGARQDLLRQRFSYYADDLVVLTWDRAFVYEPRGETDVIDVLEVANAQLLEMRYYDELLDDELPRMYDLVEDVRRTTQLLASRRLGGLARRLYTLVAEVTELTEKVDNALQVTEDVYLARVYAAALELARVPAVSAAVDRKLSIIRDTYAALHEEASGARAELMEFAILILIAMEIVLAITRH